MKPGVRERRFVRDGKAVVRFALTKRTRAVIGKLKRAGVEIESMGGNAVKGRISLAKLAAISVISEVIYVSALY